MKPKARENITAEMKLRCFSLTVLDSLCGMVCFFMKLEYLGSDVKIVPFLLTDAIFGIETEAFQMAPPFDTTM